MSNPKPEYIELTGPHTHAGKVYGAGAILELRADQAKRLEARGHKAATASDYKAQHEKSDSANG